MPGVLIFIERCRTICILPISKKFEVHGYKSLGRKVTDASNLGEGWRCQVRVKCDVLTLLVYKVVGKFLELPSSQHFIKAPYQFTR